MTKDGDMVKTWCAYTPEYLTSIKASSYRGQRLIHRNRWQPVYLRDGSSIPQRCHLY